MFSEGFAPFIEISRKMPSGILRNQPCIEPFSSCIGRSLRNDDDIDVLSPHRRSIKTDHRISLYRCELSCRILGFQRRESGRVQDH